MKNYILALITLSMLFNGCSNTTDSDDDNTDTQTKSSAYTLLAWNDLGMHCFDGKDFSVFSILPPYNNLNAHLINYNLTDNKLVTSDVTLTYEALEHESSINTSSADKTNFWDYASKLFPGANPPNDVGLTGNKTPSTIPQVMTYNETHKWFEADGIPILNYDDDTNNKNFYPMVKVVAKDSNGKVLATADVVLPVSDEMDCSKCHSSTSILDDAKPIGGWVNHADSLKDYKLNILRLHDENSPISSADLAEVNAKGYNYNSSLYDTAINGTPILCASCHSSNALATTGVGTIASLTSVIHSKHGEVLDPDTNSKLNSSTNRTACYSCHPGAETQCLRGAMGKATDSFGNQTMQCQSCHGNIDDVGNSSREGWLDQPNCQVCHQNGERYENALVNGSLRAVLDNKFATNPNTPSLGKSLYRFSTGHGDLQCSSCHGSTHAIYPTSHSADNILSNAVQGHSGTIAECTSCHTTVPKTTTGGPHGMHTVGQSWVEDHEDVAEDNHTQCATCHGSDYRGSFLSKTFSARSFDADEKTQIYAKGDIVSCYDCHDGPDGD